MKFIVLLSAICISQFSLTAQTFIPGGKTILVIDHSNKVPRIIKRLGVPKQPVPDIPDNEFDNLFLVKLIKGKAKLITTKYGVKLVKTATDNFKHLTISNKSDIKKSDIRNSLLTILQITPFKFNQMLC